MSLLKSKCKSVSVEMNGIPLMYDPHSLWTNRIEQKLLDSQDSLASIFTVNFEIYALMLENPDYREIIQHGDWITVDGASISVLILLKKLRLVRRTCGSDLIHDLLSVCLKCNKKVAVIGGKVENLNAAVANVQRNYPGIQVVGFSPKYPCPVNVAEDAELEAFFKKERPDVVAVCLGAPKQEKFIIANKTFLESNGVKIAAGLGGTVDFLARAIPRAPKFFRYIGLEWIWRCIQEPWRVTRYARAMRIFFFSLLRRSPRLE